MRMMTTLIAIAISVPIGPATGRNVVPGMTKTPQPTMQPKEIAHISNDEKYLSYILLLYH